MRGLRLSGGANARIRRMVLDPAAAGSLAALTLVQPKVMHGKTLWRCTRGMDDATRVIVH